MAPKEIKKFAAFSQLLSHIKNKKLDKLGKGDLFRQFTDCRFTDFKKDSAIFS